MDVALGTAILSVPKEVTSVPPSVHVISSGLRILPDYFAPGPTDVICGRGKPPLRHEGNMRFQAIIEGHVEEYREASSRIKKTVIVSSIVDSIHESSPRGRFVKKERGKWVLVRDEIVRDKIGQRFRDMLHSNYRSSARSKRYRRNSMALRDERKPRTLARAGSSKTRGAGSPKTRGRPRSVAPVVREAEYDFSDLFKPQYHDDHNASTDSETLSGTGSVSWPFSSIDSHPASSLDCAGFAV